MSTRAYMGKILRIDLTAGTISEESLRMDWAEKFIGGRVLPPAIFTMKCRRVSMPSEPKTS